MRLLEHFADSVPPTAPTVGQMWYDTANSVLQLCTSTSPLIWKSQSGIQIGANPPNPAAVGDIWFQKTGSASGILYVYNGLGRHPQTGGLGGWNQIWPTVETVAGREEYEMMAELVNQLIGPVSVGGNAALGKAVNYLPDLQALDNELRGKVGALNPKDPYVLVPTTALTNELMVDVYSHDWDALLAAAKYAVNRLDLPPSVLEDISSVPFVSDGRSVNPLLLSHDPADPRYPSLERRSNRRFGIASLLNAYIETANVLKMAIKNRYSLRGMSGTTSVNPAFSQTVQVFPHKTFDGYIQGANPINNICKFNFGSAEALDQFINSGAAIQIVATAQQPQNVGGQDFISLMNQYGVVRITADKVRVFANAQPYSLAMPPVSMGFKNATSGGVVLAVINATDKVYYNITVSRSGGVLSVGWNSQSTVAPFAHLSLAYSVIRDTETYLAPALTPVFPAPAEFVNADWSGTAFLDPAVTDPTTPPPPPPIPVGEIVYVPNRTAGQQTFSYSFVVPEFVTEISAVLVSVNKQVEASISRGTTKLLSTTAALTAYGAQGGGGDGGNKGTHLNQIIQSGNATATNDAYLGGGGAGGYNGAGGAGGGQSNTAVSAGTTTYRVGNRPVSGSGGGAGGDSYAIAYSNSWYIANRGGLGGGVGLYGSIDDGVPSATAHDGANNPKSGGHGSQQRGPYVGGGARNDTGGNLRWRNAIPVTPGETLTVNLGALGTNDYANQPGCRIVWGAGRTYPFNAPQLNPIGQVLLSGNTTWTVPPNVTSISIVAQETYPAAATITAPVEVLANGTAVVRASNTTSQRVGDGGGSGGAPGNQSNGYPGGGGAGNFGTGSGFTGNGGTGGTSGTTQSTQTWYQREPYQVTMRTRGTGTAGTGSPYPGGAGGDSGYDRIQYYNGRLPDGTVITPGDAGAVPVSTGEPGGNVSIGGSSSPDGGGAPGKIGGALAYKNNIPVTPGQVLTVNAAKGRVRIIFGPGRVFPTNMADV